ncbi:MAG TPA: SPOR domain-containing protein [Thermoanaerobaculia bacterium]|nr:SPOR domain-containing protein [Thermoanaerobaculia bacterium]
MPEPRSHYQLSFTAKQAMAFFVVCLVALGLSFFFGLMTGLSGRVKGAAATAPGVVTPTIPSDEAAAGSRAAGQEAAPSVTPGGSDRLGGTAEPTAEPTAPPVLRAFEDRSEGPTPAAAPSSGRSPTPGRAASAGGNIWVQVASLTSREEADALIRRLSRAGYRAHLAPAQTASGRLFRVRVGPYRAEEEAERAAEKLRRKEKLKQTWIVREGQ